MLQLIFLLATAWLVGSSELPPSCDKPVYCDSKLLHHVQLSHIYTDSKTFVDMEMNFNETKTLADFDQLLNDTDNNPSKQQIQEFVDKYFSSVGELEEWVPSDFTTNPEFVKTIKDEKLRQFGQQINNIWLNISRKIKDEVHAEPERFSLIPLKNGFIIPGGRFKEIYYWDTYWIVEGLLISGMEKTARGVIENLIELLNLLGHIPNGSRWYYQRRSQPPMLSAMMAIYYKYTEDIDFIRDNIDSLEKEVKYWQDTQHISVAKGGKEYHLLQYNVPSSGPRPESYREDYNKAQQLNESRRTDFYMDIKSAAESGWDFSSRWFINEDGANDGVLLDIHTTSIVPVDLNAIFAGVLQNVADFYTLLKMPQKAIRYAKAAVEWRLAIQAILWNEEEGVWFDYDLKNKVHRKYFFPSNVAPLWQGAIGHRFLRENGHRVVDYLKRSGALDTPGGIPTSLYKSGEQWDMPNVWPPLVSIVVNALERVGSKEAKTMAVDAAQTFVRSCRDGFNKYGQMFEKYDAYMPGEIGDGGEYVPQIGFGWSNGAVLEFLSKYGSVLTAEDSQTREANTTPQATPTPKPNGSKY